MIIDERVRYPGRPAQKELLKLEQLSGDGRDIVCTPQEVQGLAPSASTMPTGGMRAASRQRYRSPRRRLTRCHRAGSCCPGLWCASGDAPCRLHALPTLRSPARARWCCSELLRARAPLTRAREQQERAKTKRARQETFNRRRGSSVCSKAPCWFSIAPRLPRRRFHIESRRIWGLLWGHGSSETTPDQTPYTRKRLVG